MRQLRSKDRPRAVYTSILSPSFWFLFYGATRDRFCIIMIQEQHHRTSVRLRPSSADRFRQILGYPRQDLKKNLCELYMYTLATYQALMSSCTHLLSVLQREIPPRIHARIIRYTQRLTITNAESQHADWTNELQPLRMISHVQR